MKISELTQHADVLMSSGRHDEAKRILLDAIAQNPQDKGLYSDSISIFVAGGMFQEAEELFKKYSDTTGESLESVGGTDFSLQEIRKFAEKAAASPQQQADGGVIFRAYPLFSFHEGGFGINLWSVISGITQLVMYPDRLEITVRSRKATYSWDKLKATVVTKNSNPNVIPVNYITIQALDRVYKLKTVPNAPQYFENETKLLVELRKHLVV